MFEINECSDIEESFFSTADFQNNEYFKAAQKDIENKSPPSKKRKSFEISSNSVTSRKNEHFDRKSEPEINTGIPKRSNKNEVEAKSFQKLKTVTFEDDFELNDLALASALDSLDHFNSDLVSAKPSETDENGEVLKLSNNLDHHEKFKSVNCRILSCDNQKRVLLPNENKTGSNVEKGFATPFKSIDSNSQRNNQWTTGKFPRSDDKKEMTVCKSNETSTTPTTHNVQASDKCTVIATIQESAVRSQHDLLSLKSTSRNSGADISSSKNSSVSNHHSDFLVSHRQLYIAQDNQYEKLKGLQSTPCDVVTSNSQPCLQRVSAGTPILHQGTYVKTSSNLTKFDTPVLCQGRTPKTSNDMNNYGTPVLHQGGTDKANSNITICSTPVLRQDGCPKTSGNLNNSSTPVLRQGGTAKSSSSMTTSSTPVLHELHQGRTSKRDSNLAMCGTPVLHHGESAKAGSSLNTSNSPVLHQFGAAKEKRRRKFPGPAGVLPTLQPGMNLDAVNVMKPVLPRAETRKMVTDTSDIPCTQNNWEDRFQEDPWINMKRDLEPKAEHMLQEFCIASLLKKASKRILPRGKVPVVCVMIDQVNTHNVDASVVLRDPSGEMKGTIHHQLMKDHPTELVSGTVLVLRQCGVFSPSPRSHYLNITPNNVVRIYTKSAAGDTKCNGVSDFTTDDFIIPKTPVTPRQLSFTSVQPQNESKNSPSRLPFGIIGNRQTFNIARNQSPTFQQTYSPRIVRTPSQAQSPRFLSNSSYSDTKRIHNPPYQVSNIRHSALGRDGAPVTSPSSFKQNFPARSAEMDRLEQRQPGTNTIHTTGCNIPHSQMTSQVSSNKTDFRPVTKGIDSPKDYGKKVFNFKKSKNIVSKGQTPSVVSGQTPSVVSGHTPSVVSNTMSGGHMPSVVSSTEATEFSLEQDNLDELLAGIDEEMFTDM